MRQTRKPRGHAATFDPSFGTAVQALDALRRGVISSRELTAHVFERTRRHNRRLNLFLTLAEEQAMAAAARADQAFARKRPLGRLHGLPVTVKDVFATAGVRTTSGAKALESYVPQEDAAAVARLKAEGAVLVGKTNVPEFAGDWQSFNALAGTSNNPWDVGRTPGGSTGGGAAALAAGLGFLELGGDLAGSIRIPAHFCGVYGHRPTLDIVPMGGHIPPPPGVPPVPAELGVAGPLARSAQDLRLALDVLAGPHGPESVAYHFGLPAPRKGTLRGYRLGYVVDDPFCPVDPSVKEAVSNAIDALRRSGAHLAEGWPPGVDPARQYATYAWLVAAFLSVTLPDDVFKEMQQGADHARDPWVKGTTSTHRDWLRQSGRRLQARAVWQDYFKKMDAFLMPACFVAAFPHDHRKAMDERTVTVAGARRPYTDLGKWTCFSTLTGCPATAAPVGLTKDGLPVGMQILGPFLEDGTTIDVAAKMAEAAGGFVSAPALRM